MKYTRSVPKSKHTQGSKKKGRHAAFLVRQKRRDREQQIENLQNVIDKETLL